MLSSNQINSAVKQMFDDISFPKEPSGLYDPLRYMISIGGKRIRPKLCLLAYSLFRDGLGTDVLEPARALEVFHSFTLLHDDIMDHSPLRRGQSTVWAKWSENAAILSGDVMLIDAYKRIAKTPVPHLSEVLELFSGTAAQVCEGQQFDMEFESRNEVSMEEYLEMIGLKTAVLLGCSAKIGAILADAPAYACDALYNYGYELGIAFQIADDYLDVFGDEQVFGKPIGGDILNCKKSWLTVRACEKSADKPSFVKALSAPAETEEEKGAKIASIKNIYVELGVDKDASEEIVRYSRRAMDAVSSIKLGSVRFEALRRFAENLVGRVK